MNNSQFKTWGYIQQMAIACLLQTVLSCSGCATEEEEDHHLEHIIPAHKPLSFSECVEQLAQRGKQFYAKELADEKAHELEDIVNWLPELAADSDLKRPQWEQVQSITKQLQTLIDSTLDSKSEKQWKQHVTALTELIASSNINTYESTTTEHSQDETAKEPSHD